MPYLCVHILLKMKKSTTKTKKKPAVKAVDLSAEKKKRLLKALEVTHGIISPACASAGVERKSYYNWLASDPDFASAVAEIQESQLDFVESSLLSKINEGDTTAMIFYLKTRGKERGYTERKELTGKDGAELNKEIRVVVVHPDDGH